MAKRYYYLIGFLILIVIFSRIDFDRFLSNLSNVNLLAFFLINLLIAPIIFLKSLRWNYILQFQSIYCSLKDTFLLYLSGIYAGLITPARLGESVKVFYLRNSKGVVMGKGLATIFIDRLCDLYLLISLGLLGMWKVYFVDNNWPMLIIIIFVLISAPFMLLNKKLIAWIARYLQNINLFKRYHPRVKFHYDEFCNSVKRINFRRALLIVGVTLGSALLYFWQCYWLISLVGLKISFFTVIFFIAIVDLVKLLPITIMGIGTREATLIYLFSLIGVRAEEAVAVSILIFTSFYVLTGIIGFFAWQIKISQE